MHRSDQLKQQPPQSIAKVKRKQITIRSIGICVLIFTFMPFFSSQVAAQTTASTFEISYWSTSAFPNTVGSVSSIQVNMSRKALGDPWAVNKCFNLQFPSPYKNNNIYASFSDSNPPVCTVATRNFQITCKRNTNEQISFWFTQVDPQATQITININNFQLPYSARTISPISLQPYIDQACSVVGLPAKIQGSISVQSQTTPLANIQLSTNPAFKAVGNSDPSNYLNVAFMPLTKMDPTGSGQIRITMPEWWQTMYQTLPFYDASQISLGNLCSSTCFLLKPNGQTWDDTSDQLSISYTQMSPNCIQGTVITIRCPGFKNPITRSLVSNFLLTTYDSEPQPGIIEKSQSLSLDATNYLPTNIEKNYFNINPSDLEINTSSDWSFSLSISIPLQSPCTIILYFPSDLTVAVNSISGTGIFAPKSGSSSILALNTDYQVQNQNGTATNSIQFNGCGNQAYLTPAPAGQLDINAIRTPKQVKDTQAFWIEVYSGSDTSASNMIAKNSQGITFEQTKMLPGHVNNFSIIPQDPHVQAITSHNIKFTVEHSLDQFSALSIQMPKNMTLGSVNSTVQISSNNAYMTATTGLVQTGQQIYIDNLFAGASSIPGSNYTFDFIITSSQNQNSAQDAGGWGASTFIVIQGVAYLVDTGKTNSSFVAQVGNLAANGAITVTNDITGGMNSIYTLNFIPSGTIQNGGTIIVTVPPEVQLMGDAVTSVGSCTQGFGCTVNGQVITYKATQPVQGQKPQTLQIGGAKNPRTCGQTGQFLIATFDQYGNQIDAGYNTSTKMTQPNLIKTFDVASGSKINGVQSTYSFSFSSDYNLKSNDVLSFVFPNDIRPPLTQNPNCTSTGKSIIGINCQVSGKQMSVTFTNLTQDTAVQVYSFNVSGIFNPVSTMPSGSFSNITISDQNQNQILVYNNFTKSIVNEIQGNITEATLTQSSKISQEWNPYEINFLPKNPIPSTGSIVLLWPNTINITNNQTVCVVTTYQMYNNSCTIDEVTRTIKIKGVFALTGQDGYNGKVTIRLDKVKNPQDNQIGTGFEIRTYADPDNQFSIDQLANNVIIPLLQCMYPCQTCSPSDPTVCTSCWLGGKAQYYTKLSDAGGVCESSCRTGYTSNGNPNKVCQFCDPSCASCRDTATVGDIVQCLNCSSTFPFRIDKTNQCIPQCSKGYYESVQGTTCSLCVSPCSACTGSATTCTECGIDQTVPILFAKSGQSPQCVASCPDGYTNVSGQCEPCLDPCATCSGSVSNCLTCTGTNNTKFVFNGVCYPDCPVQTTASSDGVTCLACESGCDQCQQDDQSQCIKCTAGLYVLNNKCTTVCPKNYIVNKDKTGCVERSIQDLKKFPFPFLLAGLISTLIILFGMCKKKKGLFQKMVIDQNTITVIIVAIAPLQFFAVALQAILAGLFGVRKHMYMSAACFCAYLLINIAFEITYDVKFNRAYLPPDKLKTLQAKQKAAGQGSPTKAQLEKFKVPVDEWFNSYKKKHGVVFCIISTLTAMISFKFNKMFYSRFYSFDMFKATWTNLKFYRHVHTWYTMIHIFLVDLFLIVIGIAGIISLDFWSSQLYITMIETIVLSVIDIVLSGYELYQLKEYLKYSEDKKSGSRGRGNKMMVASGVEDDDEDDPKAKKRAGLLSFYDQFNQESRAEMIQGLIYKVQANKNLFLNNKLDELLDLFGDRRCKSMIELSTGWDKEEDPRKIITIPMSPTLLLEQYNGEYHFGVNDMYGELNDNCYADAKIKPLGHDQSVQGDQGQQDFNQALQRKQIPLLDPVEEDDELLNRKTKGGKRRGRKNKYYAQIDNEDDVDAADAIEPSVNEESEEEDNEAIILEQQREEEALRQKVEEERIKQEQLKAQRKIALAQAELLRRQAEEAEEQARKKAEEEEEALRQAQEQLEMEGMRELDKVRLQMQMEEQQEKLNRQRLEVERKEELRRLSEVNRIRYEEEEAKRLAELKTEQERIAREAEEAEQKARLQREEEMRIKREEADKLRAERDAQELQKRQEYLAYEEKLKNDAKELDRIRLEQEELSRKQAAFELQEHKRKQKEEELRIQRDFDEAERQRRLAKDDAERKARIEKEDEERKRRLEIYEAELSKQRQMEEEFRKRKEEEEATFKKRKVEEEAEFRKRISQQTESERQKLIEEQDAIRKQLEFEMEQARLQRDKEQEELRKRREIEEQSRKKSIEQEELLRQKNQAEEEQSRLARIKAEDEARRADEEERLRGLEAEIEAKRLQDEQDRLRRDEEDRRKEALRIQELKAEEEKILRLQESLDAEAQRLKAEKEAKLINDAQEAKRLAELRAEEEMMLLEKQGLDADARRKADERDAKRLAEIKAEEEKILRHKQAIEAEAKRLQEEKDKAAKEDQARKEKLIMDEAGKLDREKQDQARRNAEEIARKKEFDLRELNRIEREAALLDREKIEQERKIALEKARQRELDQKELDGIEREAEELERKEMIRAERDRLEKAKARPQPKDLAAANIQVSNEAKPQPKEFTTLGIQVTAQKADNKGNKEVPSRQDTVDLDNSRVEFGRDKNLKDFQEKKDSIMVSPPDAERRNFNVNDVLGDWDRDEKGNVIVVQDKQGNEVDRQGRPSNNRGYLINPKTGDVVEGITGKRIQMFPFEDLDDRGELPAPFCVEKYNFNPHDLQGDLDHDVDDETQHPIPRLLQTKQGFFVDKKGRRINKHGWLVNQNGHIVDKNGKLRFDRRQLEDGDLQRLYNYNGKRFDIKDIIGIFEKNKSNGEILPISSKDGDHLEDNFGRRVNERGYLIDQEDNIIDKEGRRIWHAKDLKNGDFPKIFQFTKFNINNVIGDFEMSPLTDPILEKDSKGNFIDRRGRLVNARGYLIDRDGNVIDRYGKKMFDKEILSADGELPKVFRINLLKSDSSSSLSELMREIEKNQPSEFDEDVKSNEPVQNAHGQQTGPDEEGDGDTSVDSLMEDTPANYNIPNQRFEDNYEDFEPIAEEQENRVNRSGQQQQQRRQRPVQQAEQQIDSLGNRELPKVKRRKKKAKKTKQQMLEYLMPTKREVNMADAYGGNAKGQFRRPGVKYDKERLMNRIKTPANIPGGRAQLEALANTVAGFAAQKKMVPASIPENLSARGSRPPIARRNEFMEQQHNRSEMHSNDGVSQLNQSMQYSRGAELIGISHPKGLANGAVNRSRSNLPKHGKKAVRTGNFNEVDFEKVLGKDIDQFLEDSEWDIESYEKMSQFSRGSGRSQDHRLKAMEKVYLQKIEQQDNSMVTEGGPKTHVTGKHSNTTGPTTLGGTRKKYAPRDFQDRFVDQPGYVHKGQLTEFETDNQVRHEKSTSRSPPRTNLRSGITEEVQNVTKFSSQAHTIRK